jgi:predicted nucleotidyltransferase component of viral defense system
MIDAAEIAKRAIDLGVAREHIERDYMMSCVLASIADGGSGIVFRGGTALARVYWPDFRLSEDLDFISSESPALVEEALRRAVTSASRLASLDLELEFGGAKGGWSRSFVRSSTGEIIIDVNFNDQAYLPPTNRDLNLPYSDLQGHEHTIHVIALAEILGNKWFMLDENDRQEPRDLYDVWVALVQFQVPFAELARGHRAKYGFLPLHQQFKTAKRLHKLWETRLSHQLRHLPKFGEAYSDVEGQFEAWIAQGRPES